MQCGTYESCLPWKQATPNNIVYALVDSSEWIHGKSTHMECPCWGAVMGISLLRQCLIMAHAHRLGRILLDLVQAWSCACA